MPTCRTKWNKALNGLKSSPRKSSVSSSSTLRNSLTNWRTLKANMARTKNLLYLHVNPMLSLVNGNKSKIGKFIFLIMTPLRNPSSSLLCPFNKGSMLMLWSPLLIVGWKFTIKFQILLCSLLRLAPLIKWSRSRNCSKWKKSSI